MNRPPSTLPLAALRAFEAAARLGSFTKAAGELAMTQAAVSYQVKRLEQLLGAVLFKRVGRQVQLTAAGQRLSASASEAFALLRTACANVTEQKHGRIWITALPTVASNWLVPRLGDFHAKHPQYALQLDASIDAQDFRVSQFDVGIRTGAGKWPGCHSIRLFPSDYTVVCAPELVEGGCISTPRDLLRLPLFGRRSWWLDWLSEAGLSDEECASIRASDLGTQPSEVTAALMQRGAAMVTSRFFARELRAGTLRQPFALVRMRDDPYWLVNRAGEQTFPNVRHFTRWLLEQIGDDRIDS
jgi:LysR family glycine cleavage system transcriptional activator